LYKQERLPRAPATQIDSGFFTVGTGGAIRIESDAPMTPGAITDIGAAVPPELAAYYLSPPDFDTPGVISHMLFQASDNFGNYFYEAVLITNDIYLCKTAGMYNPMYGVVEWYRIIGITGGTPQWVWKDPTQFKRYAMELRGGFTHHATVPGAGVSTTATSGDATAVIQFTGSGIPEVRAGQVYAVTIGGSASCAIAASMLKFDLYENWVSVVAPGTQVGFWSDINAGAVAGFRVSLPGTKAYIANSSGDDYTFNTNLTLTATPATNTAWTLAGTNTVLTPVFINIERVGRLDDPGNWPEAFIVA